MATGLEKEAVGVAPDMTEAYEGGGDSGAPGARPRLELELDSRFLYRERDVRLLLMLGSSGLFERRAISGSGAMDDDTKSSGEDSLALL